MRLWQDGLPYKKNDHQPGLTTSKFLYRKLFYLDSPPPDIQRQHFIFAGGITFCNSICGYVIWAEIAEYGRLKQDWFRKIYPYKKMPSHDALSDLFSALEPKKFAECFLNWVKGIATRTDSEVAAIDGKTIRGFAAQGNKFPLHIVTAFCTKNRLTLGQQPVPGKGNELTAIPQLLDLLTLENCIVTPDALGCQKNIDEKIIDKKANYILQVKNNQKDLREQVEDIFNSKIARKTDCAINQGHGRIEKRTCETISDLSGLYDAQRWGSLHTIVRIKSERTINKTLEKSTESRYYVSSLGDDPKLLNKSIRSHWGIENNGHWNLDVIFKEDGQLKRKGNSTENFNMVSKIALALVYNEKSTAFSKPMKRMKASHDDTFRELIMKV